MEAYGCFSVLAGCCLMIMRVALLFVLWIGSAGTAMAGTGSSGGDHAAPPITVRAPAVDQGAKKAAAAHPVSMRVAIVKSNAAGCEPNCAEWIAAQGMIDGESYQQFKTILTGLGTRKLPILIDSGGGLVDASLSIGRLIRAKGLDVAVTKTVVDPCLETDKLCGTKRGKGLLRGQPVAKLSKCASSCAFILAAGARRYVGPMTFVGVHQLRTLQTTAQILQKFRIEKRLVWGVPTEVKRTLISEKRINEKTLEAKTPESAYKRVASYFNEMGIRNAVMPLLKETPNSSIHWMTRAELKATAMATDMLDGQQLIDGVSTSRQRDASAGDDAKSEVQSSDVSVATTAR